MYRAQGILKRWMEEKQKDTPSNRVAPLTHLIDLEYKQYLKLCYWTYEKPLPKGKWLLQKIN